MSIFFLSNLFISSLHHFLTLSLLSAQKEIERRERDQKRSKERNRETDKEREREIGRNSHRVTNSEACNYLPIRMIDRKQQEPNWENQNMFGRPLCHPFFSLSLSLALSFSSCLAKPISNFILPHSLVHFRQEMETEWTWNKNRFAFSNIKGKIFD